MTDKGFFAKIYIPQLWIGFAWGVVYGLIESIAPAFTELHGFSIGAVGTVFISVTSVNIRSIIYPVLTFPL